MRTITSIIEDVLANEGGYVNDPRDKGGETNFGITIATARANGYTGPMRQLTRGQAFDIYRKQYVEAPGFAAIVAVSLPIAAELVDTGVNMGPPVAGRFLQRALNAFDADGHLTVDGIVGKGTLAALKAFLAKRGAEGERVLLATLNGLQTARYIDLCEQRPANKAFAYGWIKNRVLS